MAALNIKGDAFHPEWNYTITRQTEEAELNMKQLFRGIAL